MRKMNRKNSGLVHVIKSESARINFPEPTKHIIPQEYSVSLRDAHTNMHPTNAYARRKTAELWRAHTNLKIELAKVPLGLNPQVAFVLEKALKQGLTIGKEIELFAVEKDMKVLHAEVGKPQEYGLTSFNLGGEAYRRTLGLAKKIGGRVMLGHTHPEGYGPIFSHVEMEGEHAGSDHRTTMNQPSMGLSPYHFIVAKDPLSGHQLLGIWSAKPNGVSMIHPWILKK